MIMDKKKTRVKDKLYEGENKMTWKGKMKTNGGMEKIYRTLRKEAEAKDEEAIRREEEVGEKEIVVRIIL